MFRLLMQIMVLVILFAANAEAFTDIFFKAIKGDDYDKERIPTSPNPVVLMTERPFEEVFNETTAALKNAGYSIQGQQRNTSSGSIYAWLTTEPKYTNPEIGDIIKAAITVSITPEKGNNLISIKGEMFKGYAHGKHKPYFQVAGDAAKVIEQRFASVIVSDGTQKTDNFIIATTSYTINDIEELFLFCKPDVKRWRESGGDTDKAFAPCQRQLETIGGYVSYLTGARVSVNVDYEYYFAGNSGQDHMRHFEYHVKYYKFKMDLFNIPKRTDKMVDMPYDVMTKIKTKDGKTITIPGEKENIFRRKIDG